MSLLRPYCHRHRWYPKRALQPSPGVRSERGDRFGRADAYDLTATVAALGAKVDDPVGGLDDVQVVLDDDDRAACVDQTAKGGEQFADIVEVQAGGGLVEDVEHARRLRLRRCLVCALATSRSGLQVGGQLHALGFAAGERGGGLAQTQIAQADFVEDTSLSVIFGTLGEELQRLLTVRFSTSWMFLP